MNSDASSSLVPAPLGAVPVEQSHITPPAASHDLVATEPAEMRDSQANLIEWCQWKVGEMKREAAELKEAYDLAVKNKWKASTLKRHADLAAKRVVYYEKILAALQAGYYIVPNFPIALFAIRTDKAKPAHMYSCTEHTSFPRFTKRQTAEILPAGVGEYQCPDPIVQQKQLDVSVRDNREWWLWESKAVDWDAINFPINMAKPAVMEATTAAMRRKIFDELGVLPDPRPKKDPMVIGRIYDPRGSRWNRRHVSFVIAWRLNVRDL